MMNNVILTPVGNLTRLPSDNIASSSPVQRTTATAVNSSPTSSPSTTPSPVRVPTPSTSSVGKQCTYSLPNVLSTSQ